MFDIKEKKLKDYVYKRITKICFNKQGDKKNYLVAIIVVDKNFVNQKLVNEYIINLNKKLSSIEKIKKYFIIKDEFTIENRMLTPTLKLRRKEIVKNYLKQIENIY